MIVQCKCQCAVFCRACAGDVFFFSHFSHSVYTRAVPSNLTVSALREYSSETKRVSDLSKATVLLLVTGGVAEGYSVANWDEPKTPFLYRPDMYPAMRNRWCSDLDDGYVLQQFFASVVMYDDVECLWEFVSQCEFESSAVVLGKVLDMSVVCRMGDWYRSAVAKTCASVQLGMRGLATHKLYSRAEVRRIEGQRKSVKRKRVDSDAQT